MDGFRAGGLQWAVERSLTWAGEKTRFENNNPPPRPPLQKGGTNSGQGWTPPGYCGWEFGEKQRGGPGGPEHPLNTGTGRNVPQNQGVAKVLKEML